MRVHPGETENGLGNEARCSGPRSRALELSRLMRLRIEDTREDEAPRVDRAFSAWSSSGKMLCPFAAGQGLFPDKKRSEGPRGPRALVTNGRELGRSGLAPPAKVAYRSTPFTALLATLRTSAQNVPTGEPG